jgi:hypothetical protein
MTEKHTTTTTTTTTVRESTKDIFNLDEDPSSSSEKAYTILWKVSVDALVIVTVYAFLTIIIEETMPNIDAVLTFLSLFIPIGFGLKLFSLDFAEQLVRVAGFQLGTRIFLTLAS